VKSFGVYWFLFMPLHLNKCAFHVRSGGTRCVFFALTSSFTGSNFRVISLAQLLLCSWCLTLKFVLWFGCSNPVIESFANLKAVKKGGLACFSSSQLAS
ncbi:hypothetical protein, partial [Vibrio parahaemolyticus]